MDRARVGPREGRRPPTFYPCAKIYSMPLYTFSCQACLASDDEIVPMDKRDDPLECPCGGTRQRIFSGQDQMIRIIDQMWLRLPGEEPIFKKRRRILGTDLGRLRLDKMARARTAGEL